MKTCRVRIDQDLSTLGANATEADLEHYRANLEAALGKQFPGVEFAVETGLRSSRRIVETSGLSEKEYDDIDEWLIDLESGDGWIALLE